MRREQRKIWAVVFYVLGLSVMLNGCLPVPQPPVPPPVETVPPPPRPAAEKTWTAEWAYQQGLQALNNGDYETAIRNFQLATERDDRHLQAYLSIGDVYSGQNNYLVAETYYNKVLQYDPQSVPALTALANMQAKRGNQREAISLYRKVLEIEPGNQFAAEQVAAVTRELFEQHYQQGRAYKDANDLKAATTEFQKAYSVTPENVELGVEIGNLFLQQKDYVMADGYFQQILSAQPDYVPAVIGAGKVQLRLRHYDEAANYFKRALTLQPGESEAARLLQQAHGDKVKTALPREYRRIAAAAQVTRGDVAALLMVELMLESRLSAPARTAIISDITTHWAKPYIIKAVQYGLMALPPDRDFRPQEPIQKGELAFILDTVLQKFSVSLSEGSGAAFTDVSDDNDYAAAIRRVTAAGLMTPAEGNSFGILAPLSGAEASQIFEKVKALLK